MKDKKPDKEDSATTLFGVTALEFNEMLDIIKESKTNPLVEAALMKLKTTYYLSKDHGRKT